MIGFGGSAVVMLIPRPPSASRHYRAVLAASIRNMKDLYALFVASWHNMPEGLLDTAVTETINAADTLGSLLGPIKMLKFEFSTTSFDSETLTKVTGLCMTINQALIQLFTFSTRLPPHLRRRFAALSGALEESVVGDVMAVLSLIEASLKTGDPLPAVLPVPLLARSLGLQRKLRKLESGEDFVNREMILDEDFRKYCVVVASFVQILGATDELVMIIKGASGETHVVDLEAWPLMSRDQSTTEEE